MHIRGLLLSNCLAPSPYPVTIFSQTDGVCRQERNLSYSAVSLIINTQKPLKMLAHRDTKDCSNWEIPKQRSMCLAWPSPRTGWHLGYYNCLFNVTHLYVQTVALFPVDSRPVCEFCVPTAANSKQRPAFPEPWQFSVLLGIMEHLLRFPPFFSLLAAVGGPGTGAEAPRHALSWFMPLWKCPGKGKCNIVLTDGHVLQYLGLVCARHLSPCLWKWSQLATLL